MHAIERRGMAEVTDKKDGVANETINSRTIGAGAAGKIESNLPDKAWRRIASVFPGRHA